MGLWAWLIGAHERDVGRKALRRLRAGRPMRGDVARATKLCGGIDELGDRLAETKGKR